MQQTFTLEQVVALFAAFGSQSKPQTENETFTQHIGKQCIIRTYASGVFFGELTAQSGRMVEIKNARRLWQFKAASGISLSAVAMVGVDSEKCRFPQPVPSQTILDALEIIPASPECIVSIHKTSVAEAQ